MDTSTLTVVIQAVIQIVTILGGVWAMFNKKNAELESSLNQRIASLQSEMRLQAKSRGDTFYDKK